MKHHKIDGWTFAKPAMKPHKSSSQNLIKRGKEDIKEIEELLKTEKNILKKERKTIKKSIRTELLQKKHLNAQLQLIENIKDDSRFFFPSYKRY